MIGPLRKRHRRMSLLLLVAAPLLFLAGVLSAPRWSGEAAPEAFVELKRAQNYPVLISAFRFPELGDDLLLTLMADQRPPRNLALRIDIERPLQLADPLLYWTPGEGLEQSILIGPMPTRGVTDIELPHQVKEMYGSLVIYSLAHQREVARLSLAYTVERRP